MHRTSQGGGSDGAPAPVSCCETSGPCRELCRRGVLLLLLLLLLLLHGHSC
jgi:hypothetical protein